MWSLSNVLHLTLHFIAKIPQNYAQTEKNEPEFKSIILCSASATSSYFPVTSFSPESGRVREEWKLVGGGGGTKYPGWSFIGAQQLEVRSVKIIFFRKWYIRQVEVSSPGDICTYDDLSFQATIWGPAGFIFPFASPLPLSVFLAGREARRIFESKHEASGRKVFTSRVHLWDFLCDLVKFTNLVMRTACWYRSFFEPV